MTQQIKAVEYVISITPHLVNKSKSYELCGFRTVS